LLCLLAPAILTLFDCASASRGLQHKSLLAVTLPLGRQDGDGDDDGAGICIYVYI